MATTGYNGRKLTIDWSSTTLVGVKTRGFTITGNYVDITSDDDSGWTTFLDDPGTRGVEVTVAGITGDEVLVSELMAASISGKTLQTNLPTGVGATTPGTLSGTYVLTSFGQTGEHDGAVEFSATFASSGAVTYTATVV